ncbi:MAG: hypothetical protein ACKVZ0_12675 [Gemmatimonadales bacterium]
MAVIGLVVGTLGALALTRVMGALLFGVATTDPVTYVGVAAVLLVAAVVAFWAPARRATRVDPTIAMRAD